MNAPKPTRVLIVDDEQFVRDLLQDFFTKTDCTVHAARDGNAAIAACRSEQFDVALVDLKMPGKTGLEVLAEVRRIDPALPVILMTGYPTIDSSIEAIRHGAYDYIIKPFKLQQLKELVDRAVREQSMFREIENLRDRITIIETELQKTRTPSHVELSHDIAGSPA
ncbi:MAG: response regulator [candidate division Zixibacteria bacterium]|nr:response regulator [candidate division Zixibacteria bacterium]